MSHTMNIVAVCDEKKSCACCIGMRKHYVFITATAVVPLLLFTALLLFISLGRLGEDLDEATYPAVKFVMTLLYAQLLVAAWIILSSFLNRRQHPPAKQNISYYYFHIVVMLIFSSSVLFITAANKCYWLFNLVAVASLCYAFVLYRNLKKVVYSWERDVLG